MSQRRANLRSDFDGFIDSLEESEEIIAAAIVILILSATAGYKKTGKRGNYSRSHLN